VPIVASFAAGLSAQGGGTHPSRTAYARTETRQGTRIDLQVDHIDPAKGQEDAPFEAGENVRVRLKFTETSTGMPITGANPGAWLDLADPRQKTTPNQCISKVKRLAEGSTFSAAEVELNGNYVLTLNADASVMVVDPRFGFGDTRLLALIPLKARGEDWVANADGTRLYVSMPSADAIAVIDTNLWQVIANVAVPHRPERIALQPDEEYLWISFGSNDDDSGVLALSARELRVAALVPTGRGYHHIAFSDESAIAFVTNPGSGTVSVLDVRKLVKIKDVPVGGSPLWIAWSDLAQAAYVSSESDGAVVAIGGVGYAMTRMMAEPGLGQIRFAPGGRFALVVNPRNDRIYVVDSSLNRIVQTGKLDKGPDQIAFSSKVAYVRHQASDAILMIPLESLGTENKPVSVADFPGGQHPAGHMSVSSPADSVVRAVGEDAVLVANPGDHAVYYYMEGMAAPSGNFSTYDQEPRAVMVIERNLRERASGIYETVIKLTQAGVYDLALLLDKPEIVQCFDFSVIEDPRRVAMHRPKLKIERLTASEIHMSHQAGDHIVLRFRLTDASRSQPRTDIADLTALVFAPGLWQRRQVAQHLGDGVYAVDFQPPAGGQYNVYLAVPSLGMDFVQYGAVTVQEHTP
jgi:YVTN family beta-propeller protein